MSEVEIKALNAWPTQFLFATNPAAEAINDDLVALCHRLKREGQRWGIAEQSKVGLYESLPDFFDHREAGGLRHFVSDVMASVSNGRSKKSLHFESWCHVTNDGGFHDTHAHYNVMTGAGICGIYAVQMAQTSKEKLNGILRFYAPEVSQPDGVFDFVPTDGQLVMFPGYIRHSALPYSGPHDRIVVAFNAFWP